MANVGDRIRLSSMKGPDREGIVTTVTGPLIRVRWSSDEETTVIPAPGTLTVLAAAKAVPQKVAKKRSAKQPASATKNPVSKSNTQEDGGEEDQRVVNIRFADRSRGGPPRALSRQPDTAAGARHRAPQPTRARGRHLEVAGEGSGYVARHGLQAPSPGTPPHRHDRLGHGRGMGIAQSTPAGQFSNARHVCSWADEAWTAPRRGDGASTPWLPRQGRNGAAASRRPIAGGCQRRGRDRW